MGRNVRYCPACAEERKKEFPNENPITAQAFQQPTRRLYARLENKFVGVGWWCLKCGWIEIDQDKQQLIAQVWNRNLVYNKSRRDSILKNNSIQKDNSILNMDQG